MSNTQQDSENIFEFDVKEISEAVADWYEEEESVDSSDIWEKIDELIVDFLFHLYDCSKEELQKRGVKVEE